MRPPLLLILALMLFAAAPRAWSADAPRTPNFVYVFTDDQRWDAYAVVQREQAERGRLL